MRLRRFLNEYRHDRDGSVAVLVAVGMTAMLGFLSLGTELGLWYAAKRSLQTAADAGAIGGAFEVAAGASGAVIAAASTNDAGLNGATAANGATVTVNSPPLSGAYTGDAKSVEVIISQPQTLLFSALFLNNAVTVTARAVARYSGTSAGKYCVLGLDTTASDTVYLSNNATLPNASCGVASNSSSARGIDLSNNASISGPVATNGGYTLSNNASIKGTISTGVVTADPYAGVTAPTPAACTSQTASGSNNVTVNLTPGTFCNGLNFQNNGTVNMAPGTYIVESQFVMQNNAVLNATGGVTIVVAGNYALNIGNNAELNITAPTSGPYSGMAIMGDRNGSSAVTQVFSNNTVLNINGAIYFPNQTVQMDNNTNSSANGCSQLIALKLSFQNNADLPSNCTNSGITPIGGSPSVVLVE